MSDERVIDNTNRPGQPEPGEDEAAQMPEVREESGDRGAVRDAERNERERQTGE